MCDLCVDCKWVGVGYGCVFDYEMFERLVYCVVELYDMVVWVVV